MKIWMVGGSTGEYSDRTEWCVDAWRSEAEAQARVKFLSDKMLELGAAYGVDYKVREKATEEMRQHDSCFQCDYTGSRYYICELELKP